MTSFSLHLQPKNLTIYCQSFNMKKYYLDTYKTHVLSKAFNDWNQKVINYFPLPPIQIFLAQRSGGGLVEGAGLTSSMEKFRHDGFWPLKRFSLQHKTQQTGHCYTFKRFKSPTLPSRHSARTHPYQVESPPKTGLHGGGGCCLSPTSGVLSPN